MRGDVGGLAMAAATSSRRQGATFPTGRGVATRGCDITVTAQTDVVSKLESRVAASAGS